MTKSFYSAAIFFTGLYLLVNFVLFIIFTFQLGDGLLFMQQLSNLALLQFLILIGWSIVMMNYYSYKQYWLPFWVVLVSIIAYIFEFIILRYFLISLELSVYEYLAFYIAKGLGVLYGVSLVFSTSGRRLWLRIAGIIMIFSGIASVSTYIWKWNSFDFRFDGTGEEFEMWIFLISTLSLIGFILNFRSEKENAKGEITSRQKSIVEVMNVAGGIAFVIILFIGVRAIHESKWMLDHPHHIPEYLETIVEPFEARTYVSNLGDSLRYRLMKPLDYDSTKQYPLVISLHGSGARGKDNAKQILETLFPLLLSKEENQEKYPAFLFVPQCPFKSWWGDSSGSVKMDDLVIECMLSLENEFKIDKKRRYVTGVSMGGYGTWHLISLRPELFAAAIPISGAGDPAQILNTMTVPVWAFHGANDGLVPVNGSRQMIDAIRTAGGNPKYTEFPNSGHNIGDQITGTPDILDWLFSQKRK